MPLAGRDAALKVTSLTGTSSTGVACTRSTGVGSDNGFVQVSSTATRHLEPETSPALYLNSTLVSSTNYNVNYVQGKFEWKTGDPAAGTYTADISYLTASSVAGGREWGLQLEQDAYEITEFGSGGWKQYQPNMAGAQISIQRYWTDSTFIDYQTVDALFLVELIVNSNAGWRYEAYARLNSNQPGAAVDSLVGESLNMVADGKVYFTT